MKFGVTLNNALLNQIETTVGTAPKFRFLTGPPEATPATAQSGTLIAEIALPSDWLNAASAEQKTRLGVWAVQAVAAGEVGHFRITNTAGTTCHILGSVTATGGGGDLEMPDTVVPLGKWLVVDLFTLLAANV